MTDKQLAIATDIKKRIGVNVIFNGYIHHFDDPAWFDTLLGRMADSVHETDKNNSVLYDDELNFNFRKEGKRYGKNTKKSPAGF